MEKKKAREEKAAQKKKSTAAMQRGRQVAGVHYLLYTSRLLNWSLYFDSRETSRESRDHNTYHQDVSTTEKQRSRSKHHAYNLSTC